ncbi:unnamed protein product [Peniophora sp. CBMAI 1063]|nr:unnamed protein product [Peniophora sp. CBMAI 1063]
MPRRRAAPAPEVEEEVQVDPDWTKTLPVELLCEIFYLLASTDPARLVEARRNAPERAIRRSARVNAGLSSSWRLRGWFVVAHVCARWRTLALEQTALWTKIDINLGPSWVDAFIARCDPLPFVFLTKPKTTEIKGHIEARHIVFANTLRHHASRIRQLELSVPYLGPRTVGLQPDASTPQYPSQTYAALEVLILREAHVGLTSEEWSSSRFPRLQRLSCSGTRSIPWNIATFSNITHLVVRAFLLSDGEKTKLNTCLADLSSLEQLYMDRAIIESTSHRKLHLPHVRWLGLRDSNSRVRSFLNTLDAPSLRTTDLFFTKHNVTHVTFNALLSSVLTHMPAESFKDLTVFQMSAYPRMQIFLGASQREEDAGLVRVPAEDFVTKGVLARYWTVADLDKYYLGINDDASTNVGGRLLNFLAEAGRVFQEADHETVVLPFPNVQTIRLAGSWDSQALSKALSAMSGVKHIRIYEDATWFAFSSVMNDPSSGGLFPQLETIALAYSNALMAPAFLPSAYPFPGEAKFSTFDRLSDLVSYRAEMGMPIRAIYLYQADAFVSAFQAYFGSSLGDKGLSMLNMIQEDQGMRRWFNSDKNVYDSNDPKWR